MHYQSHYHTSLLHKHNQELLYDSHCWSIVYRLCWFLHKLHIYMNITHKLIVDCIQNNHQCRCSYRYLAIDSCWHHRMCISYLLMCINNSMVHKPHIPLISHHHNNQLPYTSTVHQQVFVYKESCTLYKNHHQHN